ncbi:hypothetical protein ACFXPY_39050 [Streptomyces sp. NPDC059153]|uniref:hypothetical protein n=1 Tax=Streptomyces sp. NPDC059153 TaxID=3346743 RepID=UPI0036C7CAE5
MPRRRSRPHAAVEAEALTPGLLRSRPNDAAEALAGDVRQRNTEARTEEAGRELLRSLQGTVKKIVRRTPNEPADEGNEDEQAPCTTCVASAAVPATASELRERHPHTGGTPERPGKSCAGPRAPHPPPAHLLVATPKRHGGEAVPSATKAFAGQ